MSYGNLSIHTVPPRDNRPKQVPHQAAAFLSNAWPRLLTKIWAFSSEMEVRSLNPGMYMCALLVFLMGATVGHVLQLPGASDGSKLSIKGVPGLEYFLPAQSFSEVENTRNTLDSLGQQFLTQIRSQLLAIKDSSSQQIGRVRAKLEEGLVQFKSTPAETALTEALLTLLKQEQNYSNWMSVYLHFLYEHPTDELVGRLSDQALQFSRFTGQESAALDGLQHVLAIPLDFQAKERVSTVLQKHNRNLNTPMIKLS